MRIRAGRQRNSLSRLTQQYSMGEQLQFICLVIIGICFIILNRGQWERLRNRKNRLRGTITMKASTKTVTTTLREKWITDTDQPFNLEGTAKSAQHLIVVAGHSVTISGHLEDAGTDERDWYLLEYQKNRGLPNAIIAHISAGIREAAKDPQSLLIFSGGQTRATTGPESEGSSYYRVADAMQLWWPPTNNTTTITTTTSPKVSFGGADAMSPTVQSTMSGPVSATEMTKHTGWKTVRARTVTEEFATDSFENL
jgi:hypothetical protein